MKRFLCIFCMLILLVFLPAGCTNAEGTPPSPAQTSQPSGTQPPAESPGVTAPTYEPVETKPPYEPVETVRFLEISELDAANEAPYKTVTAEFNLGDREYLSLAGRIMPYSIKGIIGVPEGDGPFPLILITHGSHSNDDESKRFDTGFDYLVEALAANGYIAVSMDMSKPYIWKYGDNDDNEKSIPVARDHIESLISANAGDNRGYTVDLTGKIDFGKVGLIGHSRGGGTIFDIAADWKTYGVDVGALLSIAPTAIFGREEWPDCHVAALIPEYDGDVISLDGYNNYRLLEAEGSASYYATLLLNANHNYFNRNISRNDAAMSGFKDITDQLTREQQESFLKDYATGFFGASLLNNRNGFIDKYSPQPNKMYGFDVKTLFTAPGAVDLADTGTTEGFVGEGVSVEATVDSWFFRDDKILIDTVTSWIEPFNLRPLILVRWESNGGLLTISPKVRDLSKHTSLTLNLVVDSADELNRPDMSQRFTVALTDAAGNITKLVLPASLNALSCTPGEIGSTPLYDETIYYWSAPSPISCINLPLREFTNVDLTRIQSIQLIFDQSDTGSIYIDSITVQ